MTAIAVDAADFAPQFRSLEARLGRDDELMRQVFKLRFTVYCEECGFLRSTDYPRQLESDAYDPRSTHFCTINLSHELVGYVRLVHPGTDQSFPFQEYCPMLLDGMALAPPAESAEISRDQPRSAA